MTENRQRAGKSRKLHKVIGALRLFAAENRRTDVSIFYFLLQLCCCIKSWNKHFIYIQWGFDNTLDTFSTLAYLLNMGWFHFFFFEKQSVQWKACLVMWCFPNLVFQVCWSREASETCRVGGLRTGFSETMSSVIAYAVMWFLHLGEERSWAVNWLPPALSYVYKMTCTWFFCLHIAFTCGLRIGNVIFLKAIMG